MVVKSTRCLLLNGLNDLFYNGIVHQKDQGLGRLKVEVFCKTYWEEVCENVEGDYKGTWECNYRYISCSSNVK